MTRLVQPVLSVWSLDPVIIHSVYLLEGVVHVMGSGRPGCLLEITNQLDFLA